MSPTPVTFEPELLRRLDKPGPRYTSYPTADRFHDGFDPALWRDALRARRGHTDPISLYLHIPFCESVCYYCACNKVVTKQHGRAASYLDALERELALVLAEVGPGQRVGQLHFGGGTPTFLSDDELARVMRALHGAFTFEPGAEQAIEVDPRTVSPERLQVLRDLGFNRLSLGVQDFDAQVQQAVHRVQSIESVAALLEAARALGFRSTNVDLIYGLPKQTPASLARTVEQVIALQPDRVALYGYAHLPTRFKPQRRIVSAELPSGGDRLLMLRAALAGFTAAGYEHIGMDHFARPDDSLAQARREGRLQRNFQGYSTFAGSDLIALGVSAISQVGDVYSQNLKTLPEYEAALAAGQPTVSRGHRLSAEDRLRRDVVMTLMCRGELDTAAIGAAHGIDFSTHFAAPLAALRQFESDGMVEQQGARWHVTALGWYFVRAIAMLFDEHLAAASTSSVPLERFSKVL